MQDRSITGRYTPAMVQGGAAAILAPQPIAMSVE
jgi:hypothetical protein